MALEDELAAWAADRPDWQKDAIGRFCRNEALSDEQVADIAENLISGSYPVTASIDPSDVPGASACGDPVNLQAVSGVNAVNALITSQRLTFGKSGLTIIYGDNASGKSGYARLIGQAVTARKKTAVLNDVFGKSHEQQSASFEYLVGATPRTWKLGETASKELSCVRFYDEQCGDAYVTTASEIAYRPSALTLLDRLSAACERVQGELTRRIADNAQRRVALPLLADGTKSKLFLNSLNAGTTQEQIDQATQLPADHDTTLAAKLQEAARLQGSDPNKEKARLGQLAEHWDSVKRHIELLAGVLNTEALAKLKEEKVRCATLRDAARIASERTFDAEPLESVGSETWRTLWEAARNYSTVEPYHDHEFPFVGDGAVCVLCQQPLSQEAEDRLTRFEEFVTDTTSRDAESAQRELDSKKAKLSVLSVAPTTVVSALGYLLPAGEDTVAAESWITSSADLAGRIANWLIGASPEVPGPFAAPPLAAIEERLQQLRHASQTIDAETFSEQLKTVQAEVAEMQAQMQLAAAKEQLVDEVERLKERREIESAKRLTDTTGITRKATTLSTGALPPCSGHGICGYAASCSVAGVRLLS